MAINLDVQDLVNYPGTVKRVTLDTEIVVPAGYEGDEKYLLSASTNAYADNTTRASIADVYVAGGLIGWTKSSGFKGNNGKFALDATHCELGVRMDSANATVSGTVSGFYPITLEHSSGLYLRGEDVAADIQKKIQAVTCWPVDIGYQLAYKNCSVKFLNNKFYIASGTIADTFTGPSKSAVLVGGTVTNDCKDLLGFDQQVTSEALSYINIVEAPITTNYTALSSTLVVGLLGGVSPGDALCITDGTNTDYFTAISATGGSITVSTDSVLGISNSYTTADGAYIQILKKTDPDQRTNSYHKDTDELLRYMAKIVINQIDFS